MPRYEHHKDPLLSRAAFAYRIAQHAVFFLLVIGMALGIGVLGYHFFERQPWLDALLNASMILGGMGPVSPVQTTAGKLFASGYALFSGLIFVAAMGILFAPVFHRFIHRFHLDKTIS